MKNPPTIEQREKLDAANDVRFAQKQSGTVARPQASESCHWYYQDGTPCYEMAKKDGSGNRPTTLRDARKLKLLPSVTTILKTLDRPALTMWKIEQAVLVAMTAPKLENETVDAFLERVLHTERQQDAEAEKARDRGTAIHAALENAVTGKPWDDKLAIYVNPALEAITPLGKMLFSEKIIVGKGFAGKTDYGAERSDKVTVLDFKTAKTVPEKEPWKEHSIQSAAYASGIVTDKPIQTAVLYISTTEPGRVKLFVETEWKSTFENGFLPLVQYWTWSTGYSPYDA